MSKVKYRKCPECGGKMVARKSSKGNKFWGCTMWKENDCRGSAEYHGAGARAGLNLTIREIDNGYVITTSSPYAGINDDPIEKYVKDQEGLSNSLKDTFDQQIEILCKDIITSTEFVDEIDTEKHEKRVQTAKRGTTDVNELLKRMAAAKSKVESESE